MSTSKRLQTAIHRAPCALLIGPDLEGIEDEDFVVFEGGVAVLDCLFSQPWSAVIFWQATDDEEGEGEEIEGEENSDSDLEKDDGAQVGSDIDAEQELSANSDGNDEDGEEGEESSEVVELECGPDTIADSLDALWSEIAGEKHLIVVGFGPDSEELRILNAAINQQENAPQLWLLRGEQELSDTMRTDGWQGAWEQDESSSDWREGLRSLCEALEEESAEGDSKQEEGDVQAEDSNPSEESEASEELEEPSTSQELIEATGQPGDSEASGESELVETRAQETNDGDEELRADDKDTKSEGQLETQESEEPSGETIASGDEIDAVATTPMDEVESEVEDQEELDAAEDPSLETEARAEEEGSLGSSDEGDGEQDRDEEAAELVVSPEAVEVAADAPAEPQMSDEASLETAEDEPIQDEATSALPEDNVAEPEGLNELSELHPMTAADAAANTDEEVSEIEAYDPIPPISSFAQLCQLDDYRAPEVAGSNEVGGSNEEIYSIAQLISRALKLQSHRPLELQEWLESAQSSSSTDRPPWSSLYSLLSEAEAVEGEQPMQRPEADDLAGWSAELLRKPTDLEARSAIEQIESEAREQDRWDRVADILRLRARTTQVQDERISLAREAAEIYEQQLSAPAEAIACYAEVLAHVSASVQLNLVDDLMRLAVISNQETVAAALLREIADRSPESSSVRAGILFDAGKMYFESGTGLEHAIDCWERSAECDTESTEALERLLEVYEREGRHPEQVATLLSLCERQEGGEKIKSLLSAAQILESSLGEVEDALEAVEGARVEHPDNPEILERVELLARKTKNWSKVVDVLLMRSEVVSDDGDRMAMWREAAELLETQLARPHDAYRFWQKMFREEPQSEGVAAKLVALAEELALQENAADTENALVPNEDQAYTDALCHLAEEGEGNARVDAAYKAALRLQRSETGRSIELREWLAAELSYSDEREASNAAVLESWYREEGPESSLIDLFEKRARANELEPAVRADNWKKLLAPPDYGEDIVRKRSAYEALAELEPEQEKWRSELVAMYMESGEDDQARALIEAGVERAMDDEQRLPLLLQRAEVHLRGGELQEAESALLQAQQIEPASAEIWRQLAELYRQQGQSLKAYEAELELVELEVDRVERVRLRFSLAQRSYDEFEREEQALSLMEKVIAEDADHLEATKLLLDWFEKRPTEAARGLKVAEHNLSQVRSNSGDNESELVDALCLAATWARRAGSNDQAVQWLTRAGEIDLHNHQLQLERGELAASQGDHDGAIAAFAQILDGAQDDASSESPDEDTRFKACLGMARAQLHQAKHSEAREYAARALSLDAKCEEAARIQLEATSEEGASPMQRIDALRELASILHEQGLDEDLDDALRQQKGEERSQLLQQVAGIYNDSLNRPEDAIEILQALRMEEGEDSALLHQLLELYTTSEAWSDAREVLQALAGLQELAAHKAKYQYAEAVILRDHLKDNEEARHAFQLVLDSDPSHERAFRSGVELLHRAERWEELAEMIQARVEVLTEPESSDERAGLCQQLGALFEEYLDREQEAIAAYESAIELSRGQDDSEEQIRRRRRVIRLALGQNSADETRRAIRHLQSILVAQPERFDHFHQLVQLYQSLGDMDAASGVARTLRFLKLASDEELELAERGHMEIQGFAGVLTREEWRHFVAHPDADDCLSEIFATIWPVVAQEHVLKYAHCDLKRDDRSVAILHSNDPIAHCLAQQSRLLDVSPPDLFNCPQRSGGLAARVFADGQALHPTLLAGELALAPQAESALRFRVGRALVRVLPEYILAQLFPSGPYLRDVVYAVLSLCYPEVAIPDESLRRATELRARLQKSVDAATMERLRVLAERLIKRGGADTQSWLRGVECTAARFAFLVTGDLEWSGRLVSRSDGDGSIIGGKDLLKELVQFSVSESYFEARRRLKVVERPSRPSIPSMPASPASGTAAPGVHSAAVEEVPQEATLH